MQTEFQILAYRALNEFAQRHNLTRHPLAGSGNGTEYKNYRSKTLFTAYHDRLDDKNHGWLELAIGIENIATELSITEKSVTAWLSRTQSVLHPAESKFPRWWPRLAVWSLEDVQSFCRDFESLSKERGVPVHGSAVKPENVVPVDERLMREILSRRGQAKFRSVLLHAYGGQCAISGCTDIAVLEAAHIIPHSEVPDYRAGNGLLLRADLHTLFDLRLLSVDPSTGRVVVSRHLGPTYQPIHGRALNLPSAVQLHPDPSALMRHFKLWQVSEQSGD